MITAVLAFAGVAALINVTPGLDTLLVVRTSAGQGRRFGVAAALGILTGCLVWTVATAAGLTALLAASHLAYDALRIAGAGYLTWLGISALVRSRRPSAPPAGAPSDQPVPPAESPGDKAVPSARGWLTAFRSGMGTNLLNPKAGVFYMSLIPQFIPHGAPTFSTTLLFSAVDMAELAVWYWVVSGAAHALAERIRRPSFRRRMEQISGIAFLGFAVNLLADEK
ncbi:LysE family translocator [Actinoallomurus vinaceus]|uniref:LysE family translocator n=1 Tax=Actinoallomurus vinaceus TaxID=1080074 RepID=A0ABP8UI08_9ACTN